MSYGNVDDTPKGRRAVVREYGAHLVLTGEISRPSVDLCAFDVIRGRTRGKSRGGNVLDTGKSEWKRVVVVVDGYDFEPTGEGEGEDGVRTDVARAACDQNSLFG